jgi:CheY-like chemotaxis protein
MRKDEIQPRQRAGGPQKMAKVLVVDDDLMFALDLQHQVERLGHEVVGTARNASEAQLAFQQNHPDLILMDVALNGQMDGIETVHALQGARPLPVIFISSANDAQTITRAVQEAPYAYLLKPFKIWELYESIELALHDGDQDACREDGHPSTASADVAGADSSLGKHGIPFTPASEPQQAEIKVIAHKPKEFFELFR